jgi:hypothetical protein
MQLLLMDKRIIDFVNSTMRRLEFPGLNSYQRLILHRLAALFNLDHVVDPNTKSVILYKNTLTKMYTEIIINSSSVKLADIPLLDDQPIIHEPIKTIKKRAISAKSQSSKPESKPIEKSMQEREATYQLARAKIFEGEEMSEDIDDGLEYNTANVGTKVEFRNIQPRPPSFLNDQFTNSYQNTSSLQQTQQHQYFQPDPYQIYYQHNQPNYQQHQPSIYTQQVYNSNLYPQSIIYQPPDYHQQPVVYQNIQNQIQILPEQVGSNLKCENGMNPNAIQFSMDNCDENVKDDGTTLYGRDKAK